MQAPEYELGNDLKYEQNDEENLSNALEEPSYDKKDKKKHKKDKKHHKKDKKKRSEIGIDNLTKEDLNDPEKLKHLREEDIDDELKNLQNQVVEQDDNQSYQADPIIDSRSQIRNYDGSIADSQVHNQQFRNNPAGAELFNKIQKNHSQAMKKGKKGAKDSEDITNVNSIDKTVVDLILQMTQALEDDIKSNKARKTAFKRLLLLCQIEKTLIKQDMQEPFLNKKGCQIMSTWLMPLPDNSFPNGKIVMIILQCLDRLPITRDHLEECPDLEQYVEIYRRGDPGLSHKDSQALSKNILNKWYREKDGIQTTYDKEGQYDHGWRRLQRQLDKERIHNPNDDDLDQDLSSQRRKKQKISDSFSRDPQQLLEFIGSRHKSQQHMNFTRRPDQSGMHLGDDSRRNRGYLANSKGEGLSTWQKLKKTFAKSGRKKNQMPNKGMAMVKMDF